MATEELLEQILAYTHVDCHPKKVQPGDIVSLLTVPGFLPALPTQSLGSLQIPGPLGTSTVPVVLDTVVEIIRFSVRYRVEVNGTPLASLTIEPQTAGSLPNSDPLAGTFKLPPPLVAETDGAAVVQAQLIATVRVEVEGFEREDEVSIPLELVPIPIPTVLVLQSDPGDEDYPTNKTFVMTRVGSQLSSVGEVIGALDGAIQMVNSVKDVLDVGWPVTAFLGGLQDALDMISDSAFAIAGFAVEEAPDLDDYNDFDDEARRSILFGPVGTAVEFFSGEEYNGLALGEDEVSTFTITEDFGASAGILTGFGIHKELNWRNRMWDTDSSDEMDDVESCRFV